MGRDLRVALIGYGLGGACFHAPLIASTPGLSLASIVTADPVRRAQARSAHPNAAVLDTVRDLWAGGHDLAVISTPNASHAELALAAIDAGMAVVLDKPFTPTMDQARQVIAAAAARKVPLSAYHIRRWDSECLTLKKLLAQDALGPVLRFESRLERWRPQLKGGWREDGAPQQAGGLLYDLGSHLVDQALHLFGPVRDVYAELDRRRAGAATDDDVFLALTHDNGVRSHLWASVLAAEKGPRMRVLGAKAAFVKQHADTQEAALRAGARPGDAHWGTEPQSHWGLLGDGETQRPVPSAPGDYQAFYRLMATAIRDGAPVPVAPGDALAGLAIIEAAQKSAASNSVVRLG